MALTKTDLADLKRAKELLENPGLAAKLTSMLGSPIEKGMKMLPARWQKTVHKATEAALMKALSIAVATSNPVRRPCRTSRMMRDLLRRADSRRWEAEAGSIHVDPYRRLMRGSGLLSFGHNHTHGPGASRSRWDSGTVPLR